MRYYEGLGYIKTMDDVTEPKPVSKWWLSAGIIICVVLVVSTFYTAITL